MNGETSPHLLLIVRELALSPQDRAVNHDIGTTEQSFQCGPSDPPAPDGVTLDAAVLTRLVEARGMFQRRVLPGSQEQDDDGFEGRHAESVSRKSQNAGSGAGRANDVPRANYSIQRSRSSANRLTLQESGGVIKFTPV